MTVDLLARLCVACLLTPWQSHAKEPLQPSLRRAKASDAALWTRVGIGMRFFSIGEVWVASQRLNLDTERVNSPPFMR